MHRTVFKIATLVAVALISVPAGAQLTPREQAEIDADAAAGPAVVVVGDDVGSRIDCGPGTTPAQLYFNDLETGDGGWVPTLDWEWGTIAPGVQANWGGTYDEPTGAHSGSNVWATNLDGCYTNSGAFSTLSQTFDLGGYDPPIELSLWHWLHVFGDFDWAQVVVNGNQLWLGDDSAVHDWSQLSLDLSAYAGNASVTIELSMWATTVVNRMGWYVDDIEILYCVIPVGLESFSVE